MNSSRVSRKVAVSTTSVITIVFWRFNKYRMMKKRIIVILSVIFISLYASSQNQYTYEDFAIDNEMLNGKSFGYGPTFINDKLSLVINQSKKNVKYKYILKFGKQCDIEYIELNYKGEEYGYSKKNVYAGFIKLRNEAKKECTILTKKTLEIFCSGKIGETYPYSLIKDNYIEILYDDIFGDNLRVLYPLKIVAD